MKIKSGCEVPFPERIVEGYMVEDDCITANIGVDHIEEIMRHFITMRDEPVFFFLELPTRKDDEEKAAPGEEQMLHKDVFYLDGCFHEKALEVLSQTGKILFNDGMSSFGFGGHASREEIMFSQYNVLTIFSRNLGKYDEFFAAHNIPKSDNLITAWETFDRFHPGSCRRIEVDGEDAFSIPEKLKELGMYFAERRDDFAGTIG